MSTDDRELYTVPEACRLLSLSESQLRKLMKSGEIAALRRGQRQIVIRREAIDAYIDGLKPVRDPDAA